MDINEEIRKSALEIKNASTVLPKNADVFKKIKTQSSEVIRASLGAWQNAYEYAKDVDSPDRQELLEIFETIELDTHVTAVTETMYQGISSMDFIVKSANGEKDDNLTNLFKTRWFKEWLAISVESILWGFSGIQYGEVKDDKFTSVKSIPRYNIRPTQNGIASNQNNDKADIFFDSEPYKTWTSLVYPRMFGDQYQLGKYNKIAKWFILKREVVQFWAVFNELFGSPFRVTKTDIKDNVRRQNAITAMESMGTAAYGVIDRDDEIEFLTNPTGTGYKTFIDFIEVADKQMSKALIGSTMVLDDGSSKAQGEVHKENTNSFIVNYAELMESFVNDELIPKMAKLGFPITVDDRFAFEHIETLTKKEWADIFNTLGTVYDIPADFVTEQTGIPVEEKVVDLPSGTDVKDLENKSMFSFLNKNKLVDYYKKNLK